MKLSRQKRRSEPSELNMAAMIDVVFLLLIFFLVTASFTDLENLLSANNPLSGGAPQVQDFETIRVEITYDEGASASTFTIDNDVALTRSSLEAILARRALIDTGIDVIITGDATVPYADMVTALNAARQVGFTNVTFGIPSQ